MNVKINGIEIEGDEIKAVVELTADINSFGNASRHGIDNYVSNEVVRQLSKKILLERGPEIMNQINNNQIINALIMKVAGSMAGERD